MIDQFECLEHDLAGLKIESTRRFVAQQHVRLFGDGACDRDPLLLAARELCGKVVIAVREADDLERLFGPHRM